MLMKKKMLFGRILSNASWWWCHSRGRHSAWQEQRLEWEVWEALPSCRWPDPSSSWELSHKSCPSTANSWQWSLTYLPWSRRILPLTPTPCFSRSLPHWSFLHHFLPLQTVLRLRWAWSWSWMTGRGGTGYLPYIEDRFLVPTRCSRDCLFIHFPSFSLSLSLSFYVSL